MNCTKCHLKIQKGERRHHTPKGWHHRHCPPYPGQRSQPLFNHMFDTHGLVLLESELNDIIHVVLSMQESEISNPKS